MPDTANLSKTKQALLQKYAHGALRQSTPKASSIPRRAGEGPIPLSFAQEQIWLHNQMIAVPIYNDCISLHLPGPLDVAALEQSLNEIVRRHEILRTTFPVINGQPVQLVHPPWAFSLPVIDLRSLPESEREAEGIRLGREDIRQPFNPAQGPLFRVKLICLNDKEYRLLWIVHHLLGDGVSWYEALLPELATLYEAFSQGQPSPLAELPIQYADYALWERAHLQEETLAAHLAYWKEQLAHMPPTLELPGDHPRPPRRSYQGGLRIFALSKGLTSALKELSRQEGVTLFITLVAALKTLLYRYTGQEDIVIGTVTGGRRQPETKKLIGCFMNPFVLRTDLSGNPSFRELLQRVLKVTSAALDHDELPFEYLVKELHLERSLEQTPLYQVLILLEPILPALPPGWLMSQMEVTAGTAKVDLTLEIDDRPEGLIGRFEYNTDVFEAAAIDRLFSHWQTLLEGVTANPNQPITTLPLLTSTERQQLLVDWNTTPASYPHSLIPTSFVNGEAPTLPLNGNGDPPALPARTNQQREDVVAPRTPTEEQLAAIWAELLGLKQVNITDSFFDLGGNPLLAEFVLARVQECFRVDLPLSALLEEPTIASLALKIVQSQAHQVDSAILAQLLAELEVTPETPEDDLPISKQQIEKDEV
ncbi:MAG TPA: condensation domain-containing protein [Ktedonobacterales bacterium]|nr:condensation domain-containing protein [Ktedonobacterales bacterium]